MGLATRDNRDAIAPTALKNEATGKAKTNSHYGISCLRLPRIIERLPLLTPGRCVGLPPVLMAWGCRSPLPPPVVQLILGPEVGTLVGVRRVPRKYSSSANYRFCASA